MCVHVVSFMRWVSIVVLGVRVSPTAALYSFGESFSTAIHADQNIFDSDFFARWFPTSAYVIYVTVVVVYALALKQGHLTVVCAAVCRSTLCCALLLWRGVVAQPFLDIVNPTASVVADTSFIAVLMLACLADVRLIFDGSVGVRDMFVSIGMERCVLCHVEWDASRPEHSEHHCPALRACLDAASGSGQGGSYGATGSLRAKTAGAAETSVFGGVERAGWASRWTFSWLNTFVHFGYTEPAVFCHVNVAAVVIPPLPAFMKSFSHYALPSISLWRQMRLLAAPHSERKKSQREEQGTRDEDHKVLSVLSVVVSPIIWLLSPLRTLGNRLFLKAFVDEASRVEWEHASYRNLFQLFCETTAGKRFFFFCVPLKLAQDVLAMASPIIVSYLIHYIKAVNAVSHRSSTPHSTTSTTASESGDSTASSPVVGLEICAVMFAMLALQTLFFQNYLRQLYLSGTEATTALRTLILEKVLVTPLSALLSKEIQVSSQAPPQPVTEGAVVALMTVDAARCGETLIFLHNVWGHPLMISASLSLLVYYVGIVAAASSFASLLVMIPLNRHYGSRLQRAQQNAVGAGPRVALCSEVISAMRLVKANVWEGYLLQKIVGLRRDESRCEEDILHEEAMSSFVSDFGAILVCVVCFAAYYASGGELLAETLVPALASLNLLRFPLWSFPGLLSTVNRGVASMRRLDAFLGWSPESADMAFQSSAVAGRASTRLGLIECKVPTTFTYAKRSTTASQASHQQQHQLQHGMSPTSRSSQAVVVASAGEHILENVVMRIGPGELVGVRGSVGTGKSSLLLAIMGELAATHAAPFGSPLGNTARSLGRRHFGGSFNDLSAGTPTTMAPTIGFGSPHASAFHAASNPSFVAPTERCGFSVCGTIAYCGDVPWLRNESVRKNICMHLPMDAVWYQKVITSCALRSDLAALAEGDMTVIGDRGVQLSGGQRARVALARAVYGRYDVYLLDGVLDALDEATRNHICRDVIHGLLARKTRIVVTHVGMESLRVTRLIEIRAGGVVAELPLDKSCEGGDSIADADSSERSTPALQTPPADGGFTPCSRQSTQEPDEEDEEGDAGSVSSASKQVSENTLLLGTRGNDTFAGTARRGQRSEDAMLAGTCVALHTRMEHTLGRATLPRRGRDTLKLYVTSFGWHGMFIVLASVVHQTLQTSMDVWFGFWISRRMTTGIHFLVFYALLGVMTSIFSFIRTTVFFKSCLVVGNKLLLTAIERLFRAPVSYFDATSSGTLASVLSKDVDILDRAVPESVRLLLQTALQLTAIVVFNTALSPLFLFIIPVTVLLFYNVSVRFLAVAKEVRKLENRSVGGAVAILKEAYQGGPTLRSTVGFADELRQEFCTALDVGNRARDVAEQLDRWVGVRLELVSTILATTAAFVSVVNSANIPPAFAGVAVVNCLNTSRILLMLCRRIGMFQVQFMSVEQLLKLHHVPLEPLPLSSSLSGAPLIQTRPRRMSKVDSPLLIEHRKPVASGGNEDDLTSPEMPTKPAVGLALDHVNLKYRSSMVDYSLRGATFSVPHGSFVGLVGRSGAGKSTVFNAILGLADIVEGSFVVRDTDVSSWPRGDVRRQCLVIPQDPPLLRGTWRSNLRLGTSELMGIPCSLDAAVAHHSAHPQRRAHAEDERLHDDEALMWCALQATGLDAKASPLLGLDTSMEESGHNFSAGEKQLFCLARALMRQPLPAVVMLDEVTAHVDPATDARIQQVIQSHFRNHSTVLLIAHRLQTLKHCDIIVTLSGGAVSRVIHRTPQQAGGADQDAADDDELVSTLDIE